MAIVSQPNETPNSVDKLNLVYHTSLGTNGSTFSVGCVTTVPALSLDLNARPGGDLAMPYWGVSPGRNCLY